MAYCIVFSKIQTNCMYKGHGNEGNVLATSGVNFTNVLQAAFALVDPKSAKKTVKLSSFFCAFGIKAARRTLMKLNPDNHLTSSD